MRDPCRDDALGRLARFARLDGLEVNTGPDTPLLPVLLDDLGATRHGSGR